MTSTLINLLEVLPPFPYECDEPADNNIPILRVSEHWPDETKEILRRSLDDGIFDCPEYMISCGPEATVHKIHFPLVFEDNADVIRRRLPRLSKFSLSTLVKNLSIHPFSFHTE